MDRQNIALATIAQLEFQRPSVERPENIIDQVNKHMRINASPVLGLEERS